MSNVLYIKASPRTGRSHSVAVADAFLNSYSQANPADKINTVDIFRTDLPPFDSEAVNAKYKIMHGAEHNDQDKKSWNEIVSVIEQFKAADKYVLAVPMWNFSIPYRLKQYIDILVQPGYTFGVKEDGSYEGLVKDKPIVVIYARGGQYQNTEAEPFDMQKKYMEQILGFMGFTDIRSIVVEPTLASGPDVAKQKQNEAIETAKKMAKDF